VSALHREFHARQYANKASLIKNEEKQKPRSGQTKDDEIGMCCSSAKHAVLRRKSKDWLARNQDNASEWGDLSFRVLLLQ
jgi:hypothetical protein